MIQADICRYYSGFVYLRLLPAALYTSHDCFGLFSILSRYWVQFFVSNSTKLCSKLGGGLMCVHPVSHARRTWIGRSSAGPILTLWGGGWWLIHAAIIQVLYTCAFYQRFRVCRSIPGPFCCPGGKFFRFWFPIWAQFWFLWLNGHSTPLSSYTSPCGIQIFSSSSCTIWFGLL